MHLSPGEVARLGEIWVLSVTTTGVIFGGGTSYCDLIQDPPLGESSAQVCVCVCACVPVRVCVHMHTPAHVHMSVN